MDFGLAWLGRPDSAAEYTVEHNHPVFEYSVDERLLADAPEDCVEAYEPDVTSLEPDPDWTIPDGRYEGEQPEGDTCTMDVTYTYGNGVPGEGPDSGADDITPHVAWLDGEAYFFFTCDATE